VSDIMLCGHSRESVIGDGLTHWCRECEIEAANIEIPVHRRDGMKVIILRECGHTEAMLGLSLSFDRPVEEMPRVANELYCKDGGHNKFLESIVVWLDITAPRYWWQQEATYRVGITRQSESTMHTIFHRPLTQLCFSRSIPEATLYRLNLLIKRKQFDRIKAELPEGFLQRRIVMTNYQTLRRIIRQRRSHRLQEWHVFVDNILEQVQHKEFFTDLL